MRRLKLLAIAAAGVEMMTDIAIEKLRRSPLERWRSEGHTMPRYFFHLEDDERIEDKRGRDLPDDSAARREAEGIAAALQRCRGHVWSVIVTNEWGHKVVEILGPQTSPLVKEHSAQRRVTEE